MKLTIGKLNLLQSIKLVQRVQDEVNLDVEYYRHSVPPVGDGRVEVKLTFTSLNSKEIGLISAIAEG